MRARAEAGRLVAEVSDTGVGIPADQLDHVFRPFHSGSQDGSGLGLSLCRRIVAAHGGSIGVASEAGKGATFRIEIPLEPPNAPRAAR